MDVTLTDISDEELVEISQLLARLRADAKFLASVPTLTDEEREILKTSPVLAMKSVHNRLGCSFSAAKKIVETVRKPWT